MIPQTLPTSKAHVKDVMFANFFLKGPLFSTKKQGRSTIPL